MYFICKLALKYLCQYKMGDSPGEHYYYQPDRGIDNSVAGIFCFISAATGRSISKAGNNNN
jgi:hypothetical protein